MDLWRTAEPVSVLGTAYGAGVALAAGVLLPGHPLDADVVPRVGLAAVLLLLFVGVPTAAADLAGRAAGCAAHVLVWLIAGGVLLASAPRLPTTWSFLLAAVVLHVGCTVVSVAVGHRPVRPFRRDVRRLARLGLEGAVAAAGLAAMTGVSEVERYPAPLGHRLLALLVFASLFTALPLPPPGWSPRDTGGVRGFWRLLAAGLGGDLGSTAVKLGVLWWAAGFTVVPLSFDSVGAFAATTVVLTGLVHPFRHRSR